MRVKVCEKEKIKKIIENGDKKNEIEDYKGAVEDYTKAIEIDPENSDYYNKRAISKYNLEDYEGAIEDYTKAIEMEPLYIYYYNRGISKKCLSDYKGAIEDYTKAIEINSGDSDNYYNRAVSKDKLGDSEGVIEDCTKAIEINPENSSYYNTRGESKENLGDYKGAIEDYTKAIEIDPENSRYYYNRGFSKFDLEDYIGSIEDCAIAIELRPKFADAYWQRGLSKESLENYEEAINDYTKVIELNPNDSEGYVCRGNVRKSLEQYDESISDYTKAIELSPEDDDISILRSDVYELLEKYEEALEDYRKISWLKDKDNKIKELKNKIKEQQVIEIKKEITQEYEVKIGKLNETIVSLGEKIERYANAYNSIETETDKLAKHRNEFKNFLSTAEIKNENSDKEKNEIFRQLQEKTKILHEEIEKGLECVTTLGLAESFGKLKDSFETPIKNSNKLFFSSIAAMAIISIISYFSGDEREFYKNFFIVLPIIIPFIWLAIFAGTRRSENNRLMQEYAHKEVVARTYLNYKKQIEALNIEDKELLIKLLDNTLNSVAFNASTTLDKKHKEKTPYHELLGLMCELGKEAGGKLYDNKKDKN